jgi:DNA repair protein RadC
MDDLDPEVYALDEQGRPVTKYYTPLTGPDGKPTGVFRADQARGRYMRGPSGRMEEALRPTERRSMADRILGRDDPRALNERTWIDKLAGVPNAISRSVDDAGADMAAGLGVVSAKMGTTPTVQIKTESGRVIAERPRMAEETFFGEMATDLRERGKQFTVHPNDKQNFLAYQLPTGATQMLMQMGTAKLGGTSAAVTAFSTQAAGRGYEEAKSFGATEDDALLAGLLNAPVGALEMLPISGAFKRVNQATGGTFLQSLKRMIVDGVKGGAEEMVQEALSQTLSNKVAQQLYDEERNLLQGTAEGMKQGAGVGGLMNMLLSGMTRTRMGIDAARKANAPEQVWAEYIPPPEAVDAEWLSDETGVARREAGVSGPARHYAVPPVGPDRQIGLPQLPPGVRMERTLDGKLTRFDGSDIMQAAPEAAPLTTEEQAQLPVNVAKRNTEVALKQQQDRRAAYENRSKKFERLNKMMDRFDKAMGAIPESFVQENESDFDELSKAIEDNNPGRFQEVANVLAKKARNIRSREGKKAKHPEPVQEAPLKPVTQETLTAGVAPESDLTMEERAQLPLERIQARDQQQSAEWRRPMEEKRSEAWERLQNNARRLPMRENDHPVAQMRADILKRGGIIYDKSIEADVWDKVPKNYKTSKQAAAAGKGIMWEDLINETQAMGLNFDASTTDPTELLDLLTGPKTNEDGTPRFPPSWYQEETQRLNEFWAPKLTEEQMKQTPVGEVLAQFNPDAPTLRNFTVKPDDLELGDIIRIEDTLYQVQERGSVKVLQDGKTVPLDPESEYVVNGVVKRNNPMHKRLRDLYNRIEAAQDTSAPDPSAMPQGPWPPEGIDDYIRATIEDQMDSAEPPPAGVRTESGRTFTLAQQTPGDVDADRQRIAQQEARRNAQAQMNAPLTGNTGDLGQSALFNDVETDLFAGPSAEQQNRGIVQEPAANYSVDPVQSNEVVSYLGALNVQGNTEAIAKEQLDLFDRIEASPNLPYNVGGRSDAPAGRQGSDVGGQQAALSKAFRNPLDPDSWQGVQLRPGKPATSVLHDRFKGERIAWPVTGLKVEGPGDAMALAMMLRSPYQESSKLLALDDNGKVVDARVFAVGVLNASLMHPREAFGNLPKNAKHIVLLHNHPSGDPAPSPEDIKVSKDFIAAAELMGLNVVDHVITDDWKGMSLLNSGMVSFPGAARVAYNQNQVMDRKNTNNQVYDFTVNEPDIPEWSLVPRGDLKLVHSPDDVKRIVRALRQGNPGTGFVVLMNTRNGLNGILAIDFDKGDWMQSMTRGMTDGRAAAGILVLPDQSKGGSELATARQAIEAAKKIDIKLLDVIGPTINKTHSYDDMLSYREANLVAFEVFESPRNPYEAAQRLRDAGALPEGMSVGEAAVYTVQESLAEYIAGKQKSVNEVVRKFAPKPQGPELQGSYDSLDPNVDARLKKNESLPRRKPWDIDAEHLREMARSFTRAYPEIKDTQGAVIYLLESTAHVSGAAEAISKGALSEIVGKLGTEQYKLFERVLVARDVARSVEEGLYEGKKIPFGWPSLEAVRQDLARWEADAALNPEIRNAMQQRSSFMQSLRDDLVAAKLLPEAVQDVDDYFHRLVTEYMEASRHTGGADGEGMKQSDSGFQKRRTGGGDFIIDYLTAEHDVITHALAQLRFKEIRDGLQSLVDRSGELKQVARTRNLEAVHGGAENYNKVRAVLNEVAGLRAESKYMGAGGSDGAEISELLKTIEKFDVLRPFRAMKAQAVSIFEKATGEDVGPNPNDTMNDAMNEKYGQGAVWAGIQWFKAIAEEEAFIKSQLGNDYMRWKGASLDSRVVPEGFVSWRPKSGHRMFKALSVSEAVIEGILDGQRELLQEDVKEVLVSAGLYPEWIVPENVARALNRMSHDKMAKGSLLPVDRVLQGATKKWKAYKLMAPQHTVKYYFNNFTGDLDFALAAAPEITRYVKAATIESTRLNLGKGKMSKEMEQLSMNGVIGGQVRGEIASIRSDELFSMITGEKPHLIQKYMSKLGPLQKQREDILRIAAYRYYKDQIRQGKRPLGASNFEQMNDLYERGMFDEAAYMLAKQALIDYDNPTQVGQMVKDRYIPFYRWREGNAIRYARLVRNSFIEGSGYRDRAKKVGPVLAGSIARSAAQRAIQISIFGALVQAFNHIFFPEEEELMDKSGRKGHLILSGTNEQGTFNSVRMEGSLTSFLGTIGMQNAGEVIDDLRSGNATAGESLGQIGKDLTNDWLQGVSPFAKTSYEAAMKTQTWPDVFNPRPVYDRTEHMLKIISADKLYRRVTDRPMRPGHESGLNPKNLLTFTTDAGEAAYWSVRGMSRDWQQQNSDANYSPGRPTDKNVALKYFRQAHQYGDQAAADKWLNEYLDQGGTIRTMHKSLNNQHPLIGLNDAERKQFISTLSDRDRDLYNASLKYYQQQLRSENLDQSQIDRVMQKRYEERRKLITM